LENELTHLVHANAYLTPEESPGFAPHYDTHEVVARFITVLQGVWWVGSGTRFQPNNTVPMPAGAFVTRFGKQVHFDGAKDEDAVLLIVGDGPATATLAEEK
jgi:hypothetical protein